MPGLSFGIELPDKFDKISSVAEVQLGLLNDLRELFRERVSLERDYASRLQALAKKIGEKKARRMAKLVLGDEPTQVWSEETLKLSTFDNAYSKLLSALENGAQDHMVLADSFASQVIEELKRLERNTEESKKKQGQFFEKLVSDKDRTNSDRLKAKHKYDEECMEVVSFRHKQERTNDDKHGGRVAKQLEQQKIDMLDQKNTYLIAVAIANKRKNKFYEVDLPLLENQYQSIQAYLITSLTAVLQHSQSLISTHLDSLRSRAASVDNALSLVDTAKDQDLYIEYNRDPGVFKIPEDWKFESCEGYYDTDELNIEPASKVFLQNKLIRCRSKLRELDPLLQAKKHEVEKLEGLVSGYTHDRTLGSLDEVREDCFDAHREFTHLSTSHVVLTAEAEVISAALAGDEGAQRPHSFKSASFSIPMQCGYCKSSIWGLSKQGKTCKLCNLSVHSRCELKLPAECVGGHPEGHTQSSHSLSRITSPSSPDPAPSSFTHPPAAVLFTFEASSPFELSVTEGELVHLLEVDDGSGWIKVADPRGAKGLVPASYVKLADLEVKGPDTSSPTPVDVQSQGCGIHVRALYDYRAQGVDELQLQEGAMIELSAGPNGGQNYADGWWEGIDSSGRKGIFPSNYVELA